MGCSLWDNLRYDTFTYTVGCNIPQTFEQLIKTDDQYSIQSMLAVVDVRLFLWGSTKITVFISPRCSPLSAVTQSTQTVLDPFVCFIYSDCSQQLTWDGIYPCLPLLIDPLASFFFPFNGSAVVWKHGSDLKSDTLLHRGPWEMMYSHLQ